MEERTAARHRAAGFRALIETLEQRALLSAAPAVVAITLSSGVTVNSSAAAPVQSMLTSIAVKFNGAVSVSAAALSLQNVSYGTSIGSSSMKLSYQASTHVATWTFPASVGGSLTDGKYQATLRQAYISDSSGRHLDTDGDGKVSDYIFKVSRLFGDADGDGAVTPPDVLAALKAGRSMRSDSHYRVAFDLNADGVIDDFDGNAAAARYGRVLDQIKPTVARIDPEAAPAATSIAGATPRAVTNPSIKIINIQARRLQSDPWKTYTAQTLPAGLTMSGIPTLSKYGGDTSHRFTATGAFYAKKVNSQWILVDPDGNRYFDNSLTAVAPRVYPDNASDFTSKFGTGAAGNAKWAQWVKNWMRGVGYYSVGPWSTPSIQKAAGQQTSYSLNLSLMGVFAHGSGYAKFASGRDSYPSGVMPVFDPSFATFCATFMSKLLPEVYPGLAPKTDPYLVGYMVDNELPWQSSTIDNYLKLPTSDPNRTAAQKWLNARGHATPTDADRTAFLSYVAETYFRITSQAIHAYDPKHMILGCRFTAGDGRKAYLMQAARKYIDVASITYYDNMNPKGTLEAPTAAADLPYIVSEFYAKGVDSGLPNTAGFGFTLKTQADRGAYYQQMLISMLGSSHAVGADWLSLMDNDLSNPNPEPSNADANKGLMTVHYPLTQAENPYKPLTDRIRDVTRNLYPLMDYLRSR